MNKMLSEKERRRIAKEHKILDIVSIISIILGVGLIVLAFWASYPKYCG